MLCTLVAVPPVQLQTLLTAPSGVRGVLFPNTRSSSVGSSRLDLNKMWHCLHYVLTGTAWEGDAPLSLAILGGTDIGEDTGYGPARYRTPDEVGAVADALNGTSHEVFMARYNPAAMNEAEVYPGRWEECDPQYVRQDLARLAEFYSKASATGAAVLICMC